ncbi:MAG: mechanosensitive ion channel [Bacteroidaceae bacterium]|nr:mechanosensitive ion channel [Bacteroidaceae bacterium]
MKQEVTNYLSNKIEWLLSRMGVEEKIAGGIDTFILFLLVLFTAYIIAEIIYRITLFISRRILRRKRYLFLEKLIDKGRLRKVAYILPPVMLNSMLPFMMEDKGMLFTYTERAAWIYFIVVIVIAVNALLSTIGESVFTNRKYHDRPIKGFIQISKVIVYLVATIIVISVLTGKSPVYLIGGLGAFAAVLMLISKDSIMGFVGGFLLLENDMVRLGDWIEVPGTSINGNVIDISLTIVKVRNWDNTIATVPPYSLINESFLNWRGMSESGGRRISRGYNIKLDSIKPCNENMLGRVRRLNKEFAAYIDKKIEQKFKGESRNTANPEGLANGTVDTNAGLFRAYADIYLRQHPLIRKDMLIMVRTLEPKESGLPIQFYCFTADTDWSNYESIQAEIMEHFASVMPLFELYPFQSAGARDTVISGLLEGQYPLERIEGLPYKTVK